MKYLFAAAIGPVQDFIASARRTRDLWFGSTVLSDISRAVAEKVGESGELIFPAPPLTQNQNVANVILAELHDGVKPGEVVTSAKQAARDRWLDYANGAYRDASQLINNTIWNTQVNDVVEFYAAWLPLIDGDYRKTRRKLMRLLAGRKLCRDFSAAHGVAGFPKSSLDGIRETVWRDPDGFSVADRDLATRLRLREKEQLDAIGLVKRLGGPRRGYPSISRIAADPWVRGAGTRLEPLGLEAQALVDRHLLIKLPEKYRPFPYEGAALWMERTKEISDDAEVIRGLRAKLKAAIDTLGEPQPYLAILAADGDRMGATLSNLNTAHEHRLFSTALTGFAAQAQTIVERHYGVLIYAGGDDVLALLPLDTALICTRELRDAFLEVLAPWRSNNEGPTFSAGLAIGHHMEPMEDLLSYARTAEKIAKEGLYENDVKRDALAVTMHPRSGTSIALRSQWDKNLDKELLKWSRLHREDFFPDGAAYQMRELARLYEGWPSHEDALRNDVLRLLSRKGSERHQPELEILQAELQAQHTDSKVLLHMAEVIIVARRISRAEKQATPPPNAEAPAA